MKEASYSDTFSIEAVGDITHSELIGIIWDIYRTVVDPAGFP
jgi:hypothetical protein